MNPILLLVLLALPVACIARTVTQEEVFKEVRELCVHHSKTRKKLHHRKFFYLFTCEYCFSHWVAAGMLAMTNYRLVFEDWRGLIIAWFALVWVANLHMGVFAYLKLAIRHKRELAERLELQRKGGQHAKTTKETSPSLSQRIARRLER